jgi:hypothetical protein
MDMGRSPGQLLWVVAAADARRRSGWIATRVPVRVFPNLRVQLRRNPAWQRSAGCATALHLMHSSVQKLFNGALGARQRHRGADIRCTNCRRSKPTTQS